MANRSIGFELQKQVRPSSALRANSRPNRVASPDVGSRITDPRLIMIVRRANGGVKRLFDFAIALAALICLLPALITVALVIWLQDRGPVFFSHQRVGRYGRPFRCWKFRSMRTNGDALLKAYFAAHPEAAEEWAETQKLRRDPRVTGFGRFIRKASIDELPQLWNVLVGDMSLVGPRPITRPELDRYGKERRYYLLVRPGITGLWQISGRSEAAYDARVKFDRDYVEQWTFLRDLRIILLTIPAVLIARGAH